MGCACGEKAHQAHHEGDPLGAGKKLKSKEFWTVGEHPGPELVHKARTDTSFSDVYTHSKRRFTPHYFAPEVKMQLPRRCM